MTNGEADGGSSATPSDVGPVRTNFEVKKESAPFFCEEASEAFRQMTRVCFIGNSHLAAIKQGWDAVRLEHPGIDAVFFGATARQFQNVAIEDGRLVAKTEDAGRSFRLTSGGQNAAVLADYDVIVLVALGFSLAVVLDIYARHRTHDMKNPDGEFEPVSPEYFNEIAKARLALMPAVTHLKKMHKATRARGTKLWLYPQPLPCISVLTGDLAPATLLESARISSLKEAVLWRDEEALYSAFVAAYADLAHSGHAIFEQPAQTRISCIFTRQEYARGSVRLTENLNIAHPEDDYTHANAVYGAIAVRQILERVAQRPV